jgi:DHA1 family multidrug/chloramphenicol efflux transport protein-like MFS transporter
VHSAAGPATDGLDCLSPVLLVRDLGMSTLQYGLMQLPVFGGLIAGNFALAMLADRWPLGRSVFVGMGRLLAACC